MPPFVPVIICGGSGARLFPYSRQALPKPFVTLPGRQQPLIDDAYTRVTGSSPDAQLPQPAAVITITAAEYAFLCGKRYRALGIAAPHKIIGEPMGKNTAPAVAVAVEYARRLYGDDAIVAVLPSDHAIENRAVYCRVLRGALDIAQKGYMALLGMPPTYPATGFGYIECGAPVGEEAYAVKRFIEKPDLERAQAFLQRDDFLWNGGTFCFTAGQGMAQIARYAPDIAAALPPVFAGCDLSGDAFYPDADSYERFPSISFDYAVMEKTEQAAVVRAADFKWQDIGSWRAVADAIAPDADDNRVAAEGAGNALLQDCKRCFVAAGGGRMVTALGLSDVYVLDTPDALLVADSAHSENVRAIFERLKADGREAALLPATVPRPWGSYTVLNEGAGASAGEGYKVKRIDVEAGQKLSLQSHKHRSERWTCVRGEMGVVVEDRDFIMQVGDSCHIPQGAKHRMYNPTKELAAVIEVQTGDYLGEDDIVRYEDDYGRA